MCLAWKIVIANGHKVNKKSAYLKNFIYLCFKNLSSGTSANPCFPLRRDYLFTFMLSHHLLLQAPDLRAILSFLCIMIIDVVCQHDWIFSTMNYNVQSLLELWRCSAFMFCGLRKGLRDTNVAILYHGCFDKLFTLEISYYCFPVVMPLI